MIEFKNISKQFKLKRDSVHALNDVSLTIEEGDIYGIVGFSGAGKSTLVRMINGLDKPSRGQVIVKGRELDGMNKKELRVLRKSIGMVFQQFNLLNSKTVYENVAMPLILNKSDKESIDRRVREMLEFVELSDKIDAYPDQLSGGQKQRVGIARALAMNPDILLCDEATSALDPRTTDSILELLKKIREDLKITIVIITHEMHVIGKICNKVAVMDRGRVVETGSVREVFSSPRQEITKGFVNMIVKEEVPEEILRQFDCRDKNAQLWSVKYWGINQTVQMVKSLEEKLGREVRVVYATTNFLQEDTLNILIVLIKNEKDISREIKAVLRDFEAVAERKEYTC